MNWSFLTHYTGDYLDGREWQEFPIDLSDYAKGRKQNVNDEQLTAKQLEQLADKAKHLIEKGETYRVEAYIKAGRGRLRTLLSGDRSARRSRMTTGCPAAPPPGPRTAR